jgi:RNA polymerase sigma factor (TIGR02999 family)
MGLKTDVTQLLRQRCTGDRSAEAQLLELVYPELRRIAALYWRRERPDHTLQPTALIHEAYIRLIEQWDESWQSRALFFAIAARIIRRVLVDHARRHAAVKRGGAHRQINVDDVLLFSPAKSNDLLALDDALTRLSALDQRQSDIVELRFFGGLTTEETAAVLGITARTVQRDWSMARAWLAAQIGEGRT